MPRREFQTPVKSSEATQKLIVNLMYKKHYTSQKGDAS